MRQKRVKEYQATQGKTAKASFNASMWPKLSIGDYEAVCKKSFLECNRKMHDELGVSFFKCENNMFPLTL